MFEFIQQGGLTMYVILLLSVIALGLIIERAYVLKSRRQNLDELFARLDASAQHDALDETVEELRAAKGWVGHLAADMLENRRRGLAALRKYAANRIDLFYQPLLQQRLSLLSTIAKAAPMLGLFGTVWGMMRAFDKIAGVAQANASDLAKDIAIALNTTFGGLGVAIPIVFALTLLRTYVKRIEIDLEQCNVFVQDLVAETAARES